MFAKLARSPLVAGPALGRAVACMDVFFMPSVTETFGNVTTEAMAAGVPVVAARATGAIETQHIAPILDALP